MPSEAVVVIALIPSIRLIFLKVNVSSSFASVVLCEVPFMNTSTAEPASAVPDILIVFLFVMVLFTGEVITGVDGGR